MVSKSTPLTLDPGLTSANRRQPHSPPYKGRNRVPSGHARDRAHPHPVGKDAAGAQTARLRLLSHRLCTPPPAKLLRTLKRNRAPLTESGNRSALTSVDGCSLTQIEWRRASSRVTLQPTLNLSPPQVGAGLKFP